MEEVVSSIVASVEQLQQEGKTTYTYSVMDSDIDNVELAVLVQNAIAGSVANYMTIHHRTGRVEKRVIVSWENESTPIQQEETYNGDLSNPSEALRGDYQETE